MRLLKPVASGLVGAGLAFGVMAGSAAAQCEGGVTVAGHYLPNGVYVSGGCAYTNPTTPGQLYPSGAQPVPSTNPADGGSRLPGQVQPSDLIPVNSSDLGPAPSQVNLPNTNTARTRTVQPSGMGPGTQSDQLTPAGTGSTVTTPNRMVPANAPVSPSTIAPAQLPPSGAPALTGNRAEPSSQRYPGGATLVAPQPPDNPSTAPVRADSTNPQGRTGDGALGDRARVLGPNENADDSRVSPGTQQRTRMNRPGAIQPADLSDLSDADRLGPLGDTMPDEGSDWFDPAEDEGMVEPSFEQTVISVPNAR
jgi:hypothetical protein